MDISMKSESTKQIQNTGKKDQYIVFLGRNWELMQMVKVMERNIWIQMEHGIIQVL